MFANSKISDKKWSYRLWLPEPPPPAKFSKEGTEIREWKIRIRRFNRRERKRELGFVGTVF